MDFVAARNIVIDGLIDVSVLVVAASVVGSGGGVLILDFFLQVFASFIP